jgi:hypothetical protein
VLLRNIAQRTKELDLRKRRNENLRSRVADYLRATASQEHVRSLAISLTERSPLQDASCVIIINCFVGKYVELIVCISRTSTFYATSFLISLICR